MDILVIDDEPVARMTVAHILQAAGYRVRTVGNGPDALEMLRQEPMQLVVCDWSMPGMNGLEVCRGIRREFSGRYIYPVLFTRHVSSWVWHWMGGVAQGEGLFGARRPLTPSRSQ